MRTYSKKGSLQLSVNAIVVLVLAITMLGIGISFTKGLFNSVDMDAYMKMPVSEPSNAEPIQVARDTMDIVELGTNQFVVKAKNTGNEQVDDARPQIECMTGDDYPVPLDLQVVPVTIGKGAVEEFSVLLDLRDNDDIAQGDSYPCKISIVDGSESPSEIKTKAIFFNIIGK